MTIQVRSGGRLRTRFIATALVAAALAAILVQTPPADAVGADPTQIVGGTVSRAEAKDAARFWTAERMASATEYRPTMPTADEQTLADEVVGAPQGPAGRGPASGGPSVDSPVAEGAEVARPRTVEPTDGAQLPMDGTDDSGPSVTQAVSYYSYRGVGPPIPSRRLRAGACSSRSPASHPRTSTSARAPSCRAKGKNMVFTAGHCVYTPYGMNRGDYPNAYGAHYNVVFCPGYRNSSCPYGQWRVENWNTTTGWKDNASFRHDIGVLRMRPINGWEIASWVGSIGITWNQPYSTSTAWYAFGYLYEPWNGYGPYFPGGLTQNLWVCSSYEKRYGYPGTAYGTTDTGSATIGIDCNMTGGASGGGWLRGSTTGRLNGVNSYKPTVGGEQQMFSPYFGAAAQNLFTTARYG